MSMEGLEDALRNLVEKRVWAVSVSPPTGADFLLKCGERWRLPSTVSKKGYTENGEIQLYVPCSWTLDLNTEVVFSSEQIWSSGDAWAEGLSVLEGTSIRKVDVSDSARKVVLAFDTGHRLTVVKDAGEDNERRFYILSAGRESQFILKIDGTVEVNHRFSPEQLDGLQKLE